MTLTIINVEQAEVVRKMYDEYLKGKSTAAIAKDLTERGVLSPTGLKSWNRETVDSILKSEKNIGNIITQKTYIKDYLSQKKARNNGELPQYLIENHHPPIIEPEIYEAAQEERERRREGKGNTAKKHMNQTAFSKIFYCAQCGGLMIHTVNNVKIADGSRKVYHYWRCCAAVGYDFSRECKAKSYREEILEHTFMAMLKNMKEDPQLQSEVSQAIQEVGLSDEEQRRREELREKSKGHYRELYQRVEANRDREDFDIQNPEIKNITDKVIAIEKELEGYSERIEKTTQMQEELDWLLEELKELEGTTFRDDIFRRIVKRGEVYADGRIVYDLTLGIKWTAYGNNKKMPKAKDSNKE
ncbi:MAG: recombinase family protein [Clostridiales bacterium]|nr:recombinase family protein [Clostridiales bacterium]